MSLDAQILTALRNGGAQEISGAELAVQLGISRAAIWARIEALRHLGYDIEATPHRGYRLVSSPDVLHADDLLARLGKVRVIGRDIQVFQETTSTNDVMEKLARDGVREGVAVFAETQTRGRGRMGRSWHSQPGKGLWFSVMLRPALAPSSATRLMIAAAVALARSIHGVTGLQPEIKWPNDLLIGGRKIAGILMELHAELDHLKYVILGMGVNVNHAPADLPHNLRYLVSSLAIECKRPVSRAEFAVVLLRELDVCYHMVLKGQFAGLSEEWQRHSCTIGQRVRIRIGDRLVEGLAEALDDEGGLLVRTQFGRLEHILSGDVSLEKNDRLAS